MAKQATELRYAVWFLVVFKYFGQLCLVLAALSLVPLVMPDISGLLWLAVQILLFMVIVTAIGLYILPRLERVFHHSMSEDFEFSILLVVAFGFAFLAETLQMHFTLGAFAAGLFFTNRTMDTDVLEGVQSRIFGDHHRVPGTRIFCLYQSVGQGFADRWYRHERTGGGGVDYCRYRPAGRFVFPP